MRKILTLIMAFITLTTFAQTAKEYLQNGIEKHNQQDFKGAIKDYTKAIKLDKDYVDAYYNR